MNFKAIVDAVLDKGFNETDREQAKNWVRFRHAWLWDLDAWSFKFGTATVGTTAGSAALASLPDDYGAAVGLLNSDGCLLRPVKDFRDFFARYNTNLGDSGDPEAFTSIGGTILLGPVPAADAADWQLIYEKRKPMLTGDSDDPGLPDGYEVALVHGGKAEGFKLATIPLWEGFDQDFSAVVTVMKAAYLSELDGAAESFSGPYRPDQWC